MKSFAVFILLCSPLISAASDANDPVANNRELAQWCKMNSKYYLSLDGADVYNWSASEYVEGNFFTVKGNWIKQGGSIDVFCAAEKKVRRRFALLSVSGEEIEVYPQRAYSGLDGRISLLEWCKNTSAKRFLLKEQYPYNWRFSYDEKDGRQIIQGEWRVNFETHRVSCSIRQGESVIDMVK